jgi:hypothetical protein
MLSESDRSHLHDSGYICCSSANIAGERLAARELGASWWWTHYTDRDSRRLLTTVNVRELRAKICRLYEREYPGDKDTGCPADRPPPATIVTEHGDVPLAGDWPR